MFDLVALFSTLVSGLVEFWNESFFVALLKFFLVVYVLVLLVDVILLLYFRDLQGDLRTGLFGQRKPLLSENKARKRWADIEKRLESGSVSQYKAAILEADSFASQILSEIGYGANTMSEQLDQVAGGQLETKEKLLSAHQMRNRIIHETDLEISRDEAETWLGHYRDFFVEVELFSS